MRTKQELFPQVTKKNKADYIVSFWIDNKRYRYSNGLPIGLDLSPNLYPPLERYRQAEILCSADGRHAHACLFGNLADGKKVLHYNTFNYE